MTDKNDINAQDMMRELEDLKAKLHTLERYRLIVESISGFITVVDHNYKIELINRLPAGITFEQFDGTSVLSLVTAESVEAMTAALDSVFQGAEFASCQTRSMGEDGEIHLYETRITPINQDGKTINAVLIGTDITKQNKLVEEMEQITLQSQDIIGAASTTGFFTRLNPAVTPILGYTPEELMAIPFFTLIHPDDQAATAAEIQRLSDEDIPAIHFENRYLSKDGSYKRLAWNSSPAINGILYVTARDVTARRAAEEALQQSERQYRQILDSIEDFVLVKGPQSRIVWANQSFRRYYGLTNEELKGLIDSPIVEPDLTQQYVIDDQKVFTSGKRLEIAEEHVKRHDGVIRLFNTVKSPLFNEAGEVIMTVGVSRDITERKSIEEERARLASIVETTSDLVGSAQLDGRVIYLNPAGRQMLGMSADADLSQSIISDFSPEWANQILLQNGVPSAIRDGVWTGETAMQYKTSVETPVSQTIILHKNPDGSPAFLSTIARDISQQKHSQLERERLIKDLQAARRIAEENSRLKSEFLATMSHELRTPLNAIEGFTSIMSSKMGGAEYNDKTERYISRVNANSKRLLGLINDFLDLSRVESGRLELAHMPFSPLKLVRHWQEEIGVMAEKKSINFEVTVDPEMPDTLYGDEESISKIGLNLLSNAIKFTEQGGVTLTLTRHINEWHIIVSDTGIGIPPHAREYVFEEFRQVDQTSKRKYGGTGLGLAIVQKYARAMGGVVTLQSEMGQGSIFTVSLPLNISN